MKNKVITDQENEVESKKKKDDSEIIPKIKDNKKKVVTDHEIIPG